MFQTVMNIFFAVLFLAAAGFGLWMWKKKKEEEGE
jgi:LPXTG-motif cell wall-anchored protein